MKPNPSFLPDPPTMTRMLRPHLPHFTYVDWKADTASTNLDLLDLARAGTPARPWLQGAHQQLQGRGRAGRAWQNRPGTCLMFSCAFDVSLSPAQLPMLSPLSGMVACEALRTLLQPQHQDGLDLKWPNDVQWRGGKLAGILVETTRVGAMQVVIMGMGINLTDAPALRLLLNRDVADWSQIAGEDATAAVANAVQVVTRIAQGWQAGIARLQSHGGSDFVRQYALVDALAGKPVNVLNQGTVALSGTAGGVNALGQLLIRTDAGETAVTVGEVSVRTA